MEINITEILVLIYFAINIFIAGASVGKNFEEDDKKINKYLFISLFFGIPFLLFLVYKSIIIIYNSPKDNE